jgi:hypothetical protein
VPLPERSGAVEIIDVIDDQMSADDREGVVPLGQLLQVVMILQCV